MKKLLTICLLIATSFMVKAQDAKPTKEQTIAFMKRTLEAANGSKTPFGTLKEVIFLENSYSTKITYEDGFCEISMIKWESLIPESIAIQNFYQCSGVKVSYRYKAKWVSGMNGLKAVEESVSDIDFYVPKDKAESFKKACLRLAEIAKEENKDPFQN